LPAGHSVRSFLVLDFPARPAAACLSAAPVVGAALGAGPVQVLRTDQSYLAVFESERAIRHLTPDLHLVAGLDRPGMIVTAPGGDCDFVSRFFAPREGIPEDPVTGSAHCTLTPYWSRRLGKASLHARQLSARGGKLFCRDEGSRVGIAGEAVTRA
jgi:predicted PhzF superfamily epimerase YddE/YHI9